MEIKLPEPSGACNLGIFLVQVNSDKHIFTPNYKFKNISFVTFLHGIIYLVKCKLLVRK
jgi:hypothetical protein